MQASNPYPLRLSWQVLLIFAALVAAETATRYALRAVRWVLETLDVIAEEPPHPHGGE